MHVETEENITHDIMHKHMDPREGGKDSLPVKVEAVAGVIPQNDILHKLPESRGDDDDGSKGYEAEGTERKLANIEPRCVYSLTGPPVSRMERPLSAAPAVDAPTPETMEATEAPIAAVVVNPCPDCDSRWAKADPLKACILSLTLLMLSLSVLRLISRIIIVGLRCV